MSDREKAMSGKASSKMKFAPRKPESGISGEGYGASHNWKNGGTTAGRCTLWTCADCGEIFYHHYPSTPNIHEAIFNYAGKPGHQVPDVCTRALHTKAAE